MGAKKGILISLLPLGIMLFVISGYYPHLTEKLYSRLIYKFIGQCISSITGLLPFSLAELVIAFSGVFILGYLFSTLYNFIRKPHRKRILKGFAINLLCIMAIVYFSFVILWGNNYNRLKLGEILNLDTKAPTQEELLGLCEDLAARANSLRADLKENESGVMTLPYKKAEALRIAHEGFEEASSSYPILGGKYGRPKGVMLSELMCYTGITGFIFPFTGEANVNMAIPDAFLPSTIAHEMAHQRGIARENEANFIAYVACTHHPDPYFQYSGTLLALSYSLSALRKTDAPAYGKLLSTLSSGVIDDLNYNSEFWKRYSGPIEEASSKINDTYLKANKQKTGIKSYGEMVDLLIGEYRKKIK